MPVGVGPSAFSPQHAKRQLQLIPASSWGSRPLAATTEETNSLWIVDAGSYPDTEHANWSAPQRFVTGGERPTHFND